MYAKDVIVPDSVEEIGDYAFFKGIDIGTIASFVFPNVRKIGTYAFAATDYMLKSDYDVLYNFWDYNRLEEVSQGKGLSLNFPCVEEIGDYAFYGRSVVTIKLGSKENASVISIGKNAFRGVNYAYDDWGDFRNHSYFTDDADIYYWTEKDSVDGAYGALFAFYEDVFTDGRGMNTSLGASVYRNNKSVGKVYEK